MPTEATYGITFFLAGNYHVLCREGKEYRFHILKPHGDLEPVELEYHVARKFIDAHPICANFSQHEIRILPFGEIQDMVQGKASTSVANLLHIGVVEVEEPLH
jgi:hypothetical protein